MQGRIASSGFFRRAGAVAERHLTPAARKRGFALVRLLTHWPEIVGEELAAMCRPVKASRPRKGLGVTLTLAADGAFAPLVAAESERIRQRVNASYGYDAVARVRITQSAALGISAAPAPLAPSPRTAPEPPDPALAERAAALVSGIADPELRRHLEALAAGILKGTARSRGGQSTEEEAG